jgi:16S rRNA (adenine1518-N6/adenine1519-N6)-dimethyltransferase
MQSIPQLFEEFSFRPRKTAGQNFLTDTKILDQIEQVIDCPEGDFLLEVGGGYGALTDRLVLKNRPLTVVEPDHKLFAMLERKFKDQKAFALVKADIMKLDLAPIAPPKPGLLTIAGNIPYYLTTPLITRLLIQYNSIVRKVYLMVQKEVAERLVAKPGTKAYGSLTLCASYYSEVHKLVDVPAKCFRPKPKVDSAFIELVLKTQFPLEGKSEARYFAMVRAIFQSRRKILLNSLKSLGQPVPQILSALEKVQIDPQIRGEQLSMEKMIQLSRALDEAQL